MFPVEAQAGCWANHCCCQVIIILPRVICPILSNEVPITLHSRCVYLTRTWVKLNLNFTWWFSAKNHSYLEEESKIDFSHIIPCLKFLPEKNKWSPHFGWLGNLGWCRQPLTCPGEKAVKRISCCCLIFSVFILRPLERSSLLQDSLQVIITRAGVKRVEIEATGARKKK